MEEREEWQKGGRGGKKNRKEPLCDGSFLFLNFKLLTLNLKLKT
jgi:hypothetical protein